MILNKIIIFGYSDLTKYTHSWIHNGFYKAFKYLNYKVYWFDEKKEDFDYNNSLFIVECGYQNKIPINNTSYYVLHNCDELKKKVKNYIIIQVFTKDVYKRDILKVPNTKNMYYSLLNKTIYIHWMTDLLPSEIDENIEYVKKNFKKQRKVACMVGSILMDKKFGNINQIIKYLIECKKNNINYELYEHIYAEKHRELIRETLYTFTIVSKWQKEKEYIPCRIFKNISYGGFGITNSKIVYNLFNKKICYNENESELFYDSVKYINNIKLEEQIELMKEVKEKYTYINLINVIKWFIKKVNNKYYL